MLENDQSSLMVDDGAMRDAESDRAAAFNRQYEETPEEPEQPKQNRWALRGRLRSKTAWAATVSLVVVVFSVFNVWERIGITSESFREIAAAVGVALAAFGVFNDPTNREGF